MSRLAVHTCLLLGLYSALASSPCEEARDAATGRPGAFVPKCEADGSYSSSQYHSSTGHSWCSSATGQEILGTRRTAVDTQFNCSAITECLQAAHAARSTGVVGTYVPQCSFEGEYLPRQCHGSSGQCWCADAKGLELRGTRRTAVQDQVDCENVPVCYQAVHDAVHSGLLGVFIPECDAVGEFVKSQCRVRDNVGHCWCVATDGQEILGSRRPVENKLDCNNIPACLVSAHVARSRHVLGSYIPQCTNEGTYATRQCYGSTGFCWCSTETGSEIIGTRRGPTEQGLDCDSLPVCVKTAHEARSSGRLGVYIPQCEQDGSYSMRQCHSSIGHCWCAADDGHEIENTRRGPTEEPVDCELMLPCLVQAHRARVDGLIGAFVPQCTGAGQFASTQCHGSTGQCWCANDQGEEVLGTRRRAHERKVDCENIPECFVAYHQARSLHTLGAYIPQCAEDGSYIQQQCHGSTGHCWCVAENGREIIGTRHGPTEPGMDCANLPACLIAARSARLLGRIGSYVPQCEIDGSYSSRQCHGSTGHCWCVSEDGHEVLGTRRGPTMDQVECSAIPRCLAVAHEARQLGLLGTYVPQCNDEGTFVTRQCHSSSGYCWCVDESGSEVLGTRRRPGQESIDCAAIPRCLTHLHEVLQNHVLGQYIPQCTDDGDYAQQQCLGSTGFCWCVADNGVEIGGTRRGPSEEQWDCTALPECLVQSHAARSSGLLGTYVPQCEADGSFSLTQCHSSTGHCWCVLPTTGREIAGTRRTPVEGAPSCVQTLSVCQLARQALSVGLLGTFVPQCRPDGSFQPQQSHSSTGHSWCVDADGNEILGTRSTPEHALTLTNKCTGLPECVMVAHSARSNARLGSYIPLCAEDGSYSPLQCHGSTGYCWCANFEGKEIPGTRTRFNTPTCHYSTIAVETEDDGSSDNGDKDKKGMSQGAVAGVAVGVIAAVGGLLFAIFKFGHHHGRQDGTRAALRPNDQNN